MKACIKKLFLLPPLIGLGLISPGQVAAQTFKTLHSFTGTDPNTGANSDGALPTAGLILSANTLYGTAQYGGSSGNGTVFAINIDGTSFITVHSFTATSTSYPFGNSDGRYPIAGLILLRDALYGTTQYGGGSANGT